MHQNLVIVESPAKAKTIEKFLGGDYKVMSSYGHIRDLKAKEISVDLDTFVPDYVVPKDKEKLVNELKACTKKAEKVWLASDEDREGEAISWHLCEVLGLDQANTSRIVFHEITKPAILEAIQNPRHINMNLVNAQQARRILDRIVGFKLSPVLWRKVMPSLSAGRVQSVAVRLIVEREREINNFTSEVYYRVTAVFTHIDKNGTKSEIKSELDTRFKTEEEVKDFLELCKEAEFTVASVTKKPIKRSPAAPFTTSTLQQEAARKLGFTVSQTMMIAQHLYESGLITYMRTDSVNLSTLCINASREEIVKEYGEEYSKSRQYHTHSKGAQEAHEAIRPSYMNKSSIEGTQQEKRLYELIWKRTAASQMADAQIEKTVIDIDITGTSHKFIASGEIIQFDGFLKVYHESTDDDELINSESTLLPKVNEGEALSRKEILATQRFSQGPSRYTEASLVHKLEELGIGRPSTYAPTISTIQNRKYVEKGDSLGSERDYTTDTLKGNKITRDIKQETTGRDKGKLLPTDVGIVVNDFLIEHFPHIMDYNFTATVERRFDEIAEGDEMWTNMIKEFYEALEPVVENTLSTRSEHKAGERELGIDPKTGRPVSVKIGRYGPVVQVGKAEDELKPLFAQIPAEKSMMTITLEEALSLFKLPRELGNFEGTPVVIGSGRFGPYILHNKKFVSLPKTEDPITITLEKSVALIEQKRQADRQKHIKKFDEDPDLEILNGRYGPYIAYKGANYRLPKQLHEKARELTYEDCMNVINEMATKKKK